MIEPQNQTETQTYSALQNTEEPTQRMADITFDSEAEYQNMNKQGGI